LNRAVAEQRIETGIGIGLQRAVEIGQVRLRMNAFAARRIGEPQGRRRGIAAGRYSWPPKSKKPVQN
jgi:hypothetical protein